MSVTTSAATVEPPPLLFGQRSPSPPSFASPPQSPNHLHHSQPPVASAPQHAQDVDMTSSSTLPPPIGQNHDREEDALMHDSDTLANGHIETNTTGTSSEGPPAPSVAVQVAAVDEDPMDITPDTSQGLVLPNGSADPQEAPGITQPSDAPNGLDEVAQAETSNSEVPPPPPPADDAPGQTENIAPVEPPPVLDGTLQPPPPPPEPVRSDSDSSDDDDGQQPWHPIQEDTSSPDEAELKEIEAAGEVSALDHDHWEGKAFEPLTDPEFVAGPSGRIEWTIENYNGTREKPNRELVMKSEPVTIGGHQWQIKFYPKGNDSEYLSVYVECLSVQDRPPVQPGPGGGQDETKDVDEMATDGNNAPSTPPSPIVREQQHTPLPLLDSISLPKRKSVAAQVGVVLYNPGEPRVNHFRTCLHRFCTLSPDWGWTRFHGPYYDLPHRLRGQRQALLRDDKLAFTSYIRIVEDDTACLWEHHSRDNPWDSFAMTGLQSLALGEDNERDRASGGNFISAIASWMLFKPFRQFLYSFKVPHPDNEPLERPKPLICALQKVLFLLRTQVKPGAGPVTLEDVLDALEWYGIQERLLNKMDVMEIWEVLRHKLDEELQDGPQANILEEFFGLKRDYSLGTPSYRAPVIGVSSMQEAVDKADNLLRPSQSLPQLFTIELERQEFDVATRSYVKLLNKVTLDEHINIRGTAYTLFGCVVHRQTLQSYLYHPVLRPEGPGSKWYSYTDGREENIVKCLPKREAIDKHEGKPGAGKVIGNDAVAYIALYIRADVAQSAFTSDVQSEQWEVPSWIREEVEKQRRHAVPPPPPPPVDDSVHLPVPPQMPPPPGDDSASVPPPPPPPEDPIVDPGVQPETEKESVPVKVIDFLVIDSKAFLQHEGPGTFDAYDPKWRPGNSELVYSVQLKDTDGSKEILDKLAAVIPGVQDTRQIKFWFLDALRGTFARPNLLGPGIIGYSSGSTEPYADESKEDTLHDLAYSWASARIWVHVTDFAALPELPKEIPKAPEPTPVPQAEASSPEAVANEVIAPTETSVPEPELVLPSEDTPMSEPDEPVPSPPQLPPEIQSPETPTEGTELAVTQDNSDSADAAMVEVEVEVAVEPTAVPDPPAVDVIISTTSALGDTEMGGTQEDPPPPPPPIFDGSLNTQEAGLRETAVPQEPPPDEIYFFLKLFDAEAQTLQPRGSYVAPRSAKVDGTVLSKLNLPSDQKIELVEEDDLTTTRPIRNRRSFASNDLHDTTVIIASLPLTEEKRNALAARAAFADVQSYLNFRALSRNFPGKLSGHFTYNYFSSQFYRGEMKNGHRHGQGTRIYHSGATYEGTFRLGQRHGHGLYTFQNGDTYDGDWVSNQQHGTGTFVEAATGNTYVGGWKNDKKFGEGVTHWKNAQETEQLCRICWEDNADSAFYDCGHVVACLACAKQVQTCPVCRKRVLSAMKLYYVA